MVQKVVDYNFHLLKTIELLLIVKILTGILDNLQFT